MPHRSAARRAFSRSRLPMATTSTASDRAAPPSSLVLIRAVDRTPQRICPDTVHLLVGAPTVGHPVAHLTLLPAAGGMRLCQFTSRNGRRRRARMGRAGGQRSALFGRGRELAVLARAIEDAATG